MQLTDGTLLQGGKYKIESVLGQGGFGITYLASQVQLGRKVCIKEFFFKQFCERDAATSHVTLGTKSNRELVDKFMQKFVKEARTISQLNHNNIIRIHDIFEENGTAYYVMEYHSGGSLGDLVKDGAPLPEADAVRYITQIADAVGYIHEQRINHLDIKPGNILLDRKGCGVLIDFGLSKQYDESGDQTSSTPVGISHGYAPMEQYNPGGVSTFTPQSDIYSLGATLYKLVTGVTPPKAMDIFNGGLPALPAHLSLGVKKAIEQAMQLHKNDRPATAEEFVALLSSSAASAASAADETTKIITQPEDILVEKPIEKTEEPIENLAPEPVKPVVPEKKEPEVKKEEPAKDTYERTTKKSDIRKWVIAATILLLLAVCVINWWGNREKAKQQRLAAIEQARQDSIAQVRAAEKAEQQRLAAIEQARQDSIAKVRAAEKEVAKKRKKYDTIYNYCEGLAAVKLNGKWGFIDKSGNEITPLKYDCASPFSGGRARVDLNDKYGFIDKSGNEVISLKYDAADDFFEVLAVVKLNGKWGFIDKSGNEVISLKYDAAGSFSGGLARVRLNGKCGFIDKSGNEVIPLKYDDAWGFREGCARVKLNGEWGFIDKNGNEVISLKYDSAGDFYEGRASVKLNGKYGFIDKSGNEVIPLKYDYTYKFSEGRAHVVLNSKWGFIDKNGNEVIPLKYDFATDFSEGLAAVNLNDKWGFVDKNGNEVIPLKYDNTVDFSEGRTNVKLNGEWFSIDKQGNRVN